MKILLILFMFLLSSCGPMVDHPAFLPSATRGPGNNPVAEDLPAAELPPGKGGVAKQAISLPSPVFACGSSDKQALASFDRGFQFQQNGSLDRAIPDYQQAIEIDPGFCDAMDNLGWILRQQGDVHGAIDWYQRSIELAPSNTVARQDLAYAYSLEGDSQLAIEQYKEIISLEPQNPEGYYGLAGAYLDQKQFEHAVPLYRQALRLYEAEDSAQAGDAYYGLGISLAALDRCDEAIKDLERVYAVSTYAPQANYALGYCYLNSGTDNLKFAELYLARAAFMGLQIPDDVQARLPKRDQQIGNDLLVRGGYFGTYEFDSRGSFFYPTSEIPYREAQEYGWVMFVDTSRSTVCWREEFELPAPPLTWGTLEPDGPITISDDRRTATTKACQDASHVLIGNSWMLAEGDPSGAYEMRIYVEDELVEKFNFTVGAKK